MVEAYVSVAHTYCDNRAKSHFLAIFLHSAPIFRLFYGRDANGSGAMPGFSAIFTLIPSGAVV